MATSCYVGESANYRAAHDIELKINSLRQNGLKNDKAELKGVEEFAIECSIIKVATSEDIQGTVLMMAFKSLEEWASQLILQWSLHGEMLELVEFMRAQMRLIECC